MEVKTFTVSGHKGYRFKDAKGQSCSIHQCKRGITLGISAPESGRMLVTDREAFWLCQVLLNYVETGSI